MLLIISLPSLFPCTVDAKKMYPTVLLMSGDHDDRVSPLHTFKMAAELQYNLPK